VIVGEMSWEVLGREEWGQGSAHKKSEEEYTHRWGGLEL